jgi:uncharacterized protein YigE (DUF2233 family)
LPRHGDVHAVLALALLLATQFGSPYRGEYEKEPNGPHGECRVDWDALHPGLDYRAITCLGDAGDTDMHVVRIDPKRWQLDTRVVRGGGSATGVANERDSDFVINASFFDNARAPLGVVVSGGSELQAVKSISWQAVFAMTGDGRPHIVTTDGWKKLRPHASMAVQAGPRLVVDGHTNRVHQSYAAARAGVCIQKSGAIVFFATPPDRKLDMYEIGRVARRAEIDGGLECSDAMLFDGGHSTQIFVEGATKRVATKGDPVPVFVFARKR